MPWISLDERAGPPGPHGGEQPSAQSIRCGLCSWETENAYWGPKKARAEAGVWWPKEDEHQGEGEHSLCPQCASRENERARQSYRSTSLNVEAVMSEYWRAAEARVGEPAGNAAAREEREGSPAPVWVDLPRAQGEVDELCAQGAESQARVKLPWPLARRLMMGVTTDTDGKVQRTTHGLPTAFCLAQKEDLMQNVAEVREEPPESATSSPDPESGGAASEFFTDAALTRRLGEVAAELLGSSVPQPSALASEPSAPPVLRLDSWLSSELVQLVQRFCDVQSDFGGCRRPHSR